MVVGENAGSTGELELGMALGARLSL
jgi:hypothetical protein